MCGRVSTKVLVYVLLVRTDYFFTYYVVCARVGVLVDVWQGERDAFEHQLWVSSAMDTLLSSVKVERDEV
jgi:hypothetical protein